MLIANMVNRSIVFKCENVSSEPVIVSSQTLLSHLGKMCLEYYNNHKSQEGVVSAVKCEFNLRHPWIQPPQSDEYYQTEYGVPLTMDDVILRKGFDRVNMPPTVDMLAPGDSIFPQLAQLTVDDLQILFETALNRQKRFSYTEDEYTDYGYSTNYPMVHTIVVNITPQDCGLYQYMI